MKIANKKHVFFDLDHTLWDFEKNSALAIESAFTTYNIGVDIPDYIERYVPVNAAWWKLYRDGHVNQQELRYGRFRDVFNAVNYTVTDEMIGLLSAEYIRLLPQNNHLYEGAVEILDYLKTKYSLHIITNGFHEVQAGKLKNSNIDHYFDTVTNSDMAGCKKPNPSIFEFALKLANAEKPSSIMIGDCIEADVQGAIDYGLDAIYFNEFGQDAHPSITQVNRLLDLKNLL
jgi:putative hydrolase of the HAD superfamily